MDKIEDKNARIELIVLLIMLCTFKSGYMAGSTADVNAPEVALLLLFYAERGMTEAAIRGNDHFRTFSYLQRVVMNFAGDFSSQRHLRDRQR